MIRPMAKALLVLLMATTVYANDDVQDVRLRVQNLGRPDGKQSATLTGHTLLAATSRVVTVTLQVGDATVTLTGKIARSGRLRAVGRRLALATPLASFARIDVAVNGGLTTALFMDAGDCALAVRGRRLDCVETVPLPGTLTDGAYDLTFTDRTPPGTTEVGRITTRVDGSRTLTLHDSPLDQAGLTMEADGALSGDYVMGGDYLTNVAGSAMDQSTPALARLIGTFTGNTAGSFAFTMERSEAGTSSAFGGTWNLSLSGGGFMGFTGTAVLDVTVPADGNAAAAATTLVRSGGTTAYTTRAGTCTVAPAGGVYCMLPVSNPPGNLAVYLHGMLDADGGSGQGAFAIGAAPAMDSTGTWSATR
jgi:hypothetical protein